ncbi:MAG TPA: TRAP transporter substrate-binding protein [Devosia sp.]|jgi:TRAP-type C4-dicarboxylate transport system substrate-binding protein|uniref:TRAP transporter substrate-binding protein n=1 Tax=Devosia sp. TaxID=1871048 RepID=UPI002DDCC7BE|nr:TRAP transporter substrate-binding protein [Devosia sp.]HEV2514072.1 TRAP transporter substrate-binding protein [Devosia sp.]
MKRRAFLAGTAAGTFALAAPAIVRGQDVTTLRVHQMLPAQATIPSKAITPWVQRIEEASGGRLKFELYPAMQLGGAPPDLYDQAKDGVVDLIWTVLGYTPGRFPKSEVFELPFMVTKAEATSVAFQQFVEANSIDEFAGVKLLCVHTHGPGLFHTKDPVTKLEDLKGMKIRGGSRIINDLLAGLGAEPVGMPVPQVPEALSTGVITGTTIPWEVTPALKVAELVHNHTGFSGTHGLYTQTFAFTMNLDRYNSLPDDLKALIDQNAGVETARAFGVAMDAGDAVGLKIAQDAGNDIVTLDEAETQRWKDASQPTIDKWYTDATAAGFDGKALHEAAQALVAG